MVLPQPETDLRMNIIVLGNEVLEILYKNKKQVLINDVLLEFLKKDKRRTPELFLNVMTFLYSVGLIDIKGYKIKVIKHDPTQKTLF